MVRLSRVIALCFLLVPACSGDADPISAPPDVVFNHVPGEPLNLPSVGVRVNGAIASIIWHEDPFNLGAGYTVEAYAGTTCAGANLVPGGSNVAGNAWTEPYHLYVDVGPLAPGPYCARVRSNGVLSPPVFQAFVSTQFDIGSANSPPEAVFTWAPAAPLEGDVIAFAASASDPDGDSLSFAWSIDGVAVSAEPTFERSFGDDGIHEIGLMVGDGRGGSTASSRTVVVANAPPVLIEPVAARSPDPALAVAVGRSIDFSGGFFDPGQLDSHVLTLDCNYGGAPLEGTNTTAVMPDYSGSCTWEEAGTYRVLVTVRDDDGGSASRVSDPVTVFEAIDGTSVTGGGWIDSPRGACAIDPACADLSGRASFGFVSKYGKGAVPTGSAVFQLTDASLTFKSGPQLWLVVSGPLARFAGAGTLDGRPGYDFSVTAVDGRAAGGPDGFRIRIWDHESGDVVYDSAPGADPAGDATTPVQGGSIVVHGRR